MSNSTQEKMLGCYMLHWTETMIICLSESVKLFGFSLPLPYLLSSEPHPAVSNSNVSPWLLSTL